MVSIFLELYRPVSYYLLGLTLALETGLHIYEKFIRRDEYTIGLIKHIPHGLQFGICLFYIYNLYLQQSDLLLPIGLSYGFNICGIALYLVKGKTPSNEWWSLHEYTHLFVCLADYAKIYASYRM